MTDTEARPSRPVFDPITVRRNTRGEGYRATTPVPGAWAGADGVLGSATEDGPFVQGSGRTPVDAISDLERTIGRITLSHFGGQSAS